MITSLSFLAAALAMPQTFAPNWNANSGQAASGFGGTMDLVGDVNGDGFDDAVVGAYWFSNGQSSEGKVFGYLGSSAGLATTAQWTYESNQAFAILGVAIAGAGDINGDGFDDVVVGHPAYANGQSNEGAVLVFLGSPTGLPASPSAIVQSNVTGRALAGAISAAGDVNNDGFADVVVGAPQSVGGGRAFVHHGSASGLAVAATTVIFAPQANAGFAVEVAAAGDVDGDGFADVVISAPAFSNGQAGEGAVFVHRGSANGIVATPHWSAESDFTNARFGFSVEAGDFDADGFDDVAVGAPFYGVPALALQGRVYVYRGSAQGPAAQATWILEPDFATSEFGTSVANAGDTDGDGVDDLLVGAPGFLESPAPGVIGRLFVYRGAPGTGFEAIPNWASGPSSLQPYIGESCAGGGDVNGDGFADVIGGGENPDDGTQFARGYHGGAFAMAAPYGVGKGLPLKAAPRLHSALAPVLGGNAQLGIYGGKSFLGPVILFASAQPAAIPFDGGTLHALPDLMVTLGMFRVLTSLVVPVSIPAMPVLQDVSVYMQAVYVDPAAPSFDHVLMTNGLRWTFGV